MLFLSGARRKRIDHRGHRSGGFLLEGLETRTLLSNSVIDVMVLYTPQAVKAAGGVPAITQNIDRAIADTNLAMANSQVNASLRLVHLGQVGYTDSGQLSTDLANLQQGNGALGGVQMLRDRYGADLVSLWVGSGSGPEAGLAFQADNLTIPQPNYGYNVIEEPYANNDYVFAHEVGHNLGAGHDISDPTPRAIPYAYGKVLTIGNYQVGDVMADTSGDRIPYYSNPNVSFDGIPTGNPDNAAQPADNARVMNELAPMVANYEPTVVPDLAPPTAALLSGSINTPTQTLTVEVEYQASTAISVSGFGTGDVLITGPNGFHQFGTFKSVDFPADGPQRLVTYEVSIAGYSTDPSAYTVTVEPNRVVDSSGNFVASGALARTDETFPNRAGPRLCTSFDAGTLDGQSWSFNNTIDGADPTAFYKFTLSMPQQVTAQLSGLTGNIGELLVQDRTADGVIQNSEIIANMYQPGGAPESITTTLSPGTYYIWVTPPSLGVTSEYHLALSATSVSGTPPISPSPKPPPAFAISGASSTQEQTPYTLNLSATDPDHTVTSWTINWGDGNTQPVTGNPSSVTHTYGTGPNHYVISATATDDTGMSYVASQTQAVQVTHVVPVPTISGPVSIAAGSTYTLNLTGTDAGHTVQGWTVNWGDGTAAQQITGNPASVTHTFVTPAAADTITGTMTDDVGTYAAGSGVAVQVTPAAAIVSGPSSAVVGSTYSVSLSTFEPAGQTAQQWVVNWGDGTSPQTVAGTTGFASHVYTATGAFQVTATVTDQQGARTSSPLAVSVGSTAQPSVTASARPLGTLPKRGIRAAGGSFHATAAQQLFSFVVAQQQIVTIHLSAGHPSVLLELLDSNLNVVATKTGKSGSTITLTLSPGTYYLRGTFNTRKAWTTHYRISASSRPIPASKKHVSHAAHKLKHR